jgi:putative tryptophan/tyrosine transport system substrate-binding protein
MKRRKFITIVGGSLAWPLAAYGQKKAMPVVGYLHFAEPNYVPTAADFLQGLNEAGFVAGENVAVEYRWAEGHYDRLPAMAADLVGLKVDLIAAFGPPPAKAAKIATSTIPIVFEVGNDAVEAGLVGSLARPGGNATGLSILFVQLTPKRLELLCELIPEARTIALLVNPNSPTAEPSLRGAPEAAQAKGAQLLVLKAANEKEIDAAFDTAVASKTDGLIVAADPFFDTRREQLVAAAARAKVPTIYFEHEFSNAGGLMSYGPSLASVYRRMGIYAGKILRGERPTELPVEQPTTFQMVINLKTARELGITVPPKLLFIADVVIE